MSITRFERQPIQISHPDPHSKAIADRLHVAVERGKLGSVAKLLDCGVPIELANRSGHTPLFCAAYFGQLEITKLLLKLGADPNRRCSIISCTPVHAACWSGNVQVLSTLLIAGGDLRFHDQHNRSPRDWALIQQDLERRLAVLSLIESFRQIAIKGSDLNMTEIGLDISSRSHSTFKFPAKLRSTLAALGLVCSDNCEYIGPLGNVHGTGFGKILYGHGESAAALWPVPLVDESQLSDPDDDFCDVEAALNGLLPKGVAYRVGPSTEMVPRRWHQTAVTVRRLKENSPPDILFEELHSMSRLRHPGLLLLLGVSATQHWESVQLIYEPVYQGSLHYRLHIMGSTIPMLKRLTILQQVCDALLFLHSKNLLHCSITSHAVHLISTSRAKLGCLETLVDNSPPSKRVYRKVPPVHWEWIAPWTAPECMRGEGVCTLSDVYSFCCLVWEVCNLQVPWISLTHKEICDMWIKSSNRILHINDTVPVHISSFLKLGLQPKLEEREEIDLQEIYLMLRLQAATLAHSQQKESPKNAPLSVPTTEHVWEAVKGKLRKTTESRDNSGTDVDISQENVHVEKPEEKSLRNNNQLDTEPMVQAGGCCIFKEIAIKPASHTTERHSVNCFMSRGRSPATHSIFSSASANFRDELPKPVKVYSTFSHEMRQAVAQPKIVTNFEAWREKLDVTDDNQKCKSESNGESTVEVGDPTFSSTPKQTSLSFLACSSRIDTGTKPKRSLKFPNVTLPANPRFYSRNKPTTEFVASLAAIFNSKKRPDSVIHTSFEKPSTPEKRDEIYVGSTVTNADRTSRGVQCCNEEESNV